MLFLTSNHFLNIDDFNLNYLQFETDGVQNR